MAFRTSRIAINIVAALLGICLCFLCGCSISSTDDTSTSPEGAGTENSGTPEVITDDEGSSGSSSGSQQGSGSSDPSSTTTSTNSPDGADSQVSQIISGMTLEQKVAQMFVVTPEAITGVDVATQAGATTQNALSTYPVGGLIYFQKNLLNPDQTTSMIANSQVYSKDASGLPLFICVDEEGGTVSRIGGNEGFGIENVGNMADVGASGDTAKAKDVAVTIGTYLKGLGFNVDFAPDADICGDPSTDVMAKRSFGTDPTLVSSMVGSQVEGFLSTGILCSAKHFPGIGGVEGDSHEQSIVSNKTLDELRETNLLPFEAAMSADVPFIMVGHLSLPEALGNSIPASINSAIVTDLLRDELGYDGIIITDSMSMSAAEEYCAADQVGVAAIQAGVDMVLMPSDFVSAYQSVIDAVQDGTISEERIDDSLRRIVATKLNFLS